MEKEKKQWIAPQATQIYVNGGPNPSTTTSEGYIYHTAVAS